MDEDTQFWRGPLVQPHIRSGNSGTVMQHKILSWDGKIPVAEAAELCVASVFFSKAIENAWQSKLFYYN